MFKICVILVLFQVISMINAKRVYYSPDETVHQNLRNVDPQSYLLPFKAINGDDEYLRLLKSSRSTGPVHTYVKTDKNANVKWGVRHYVGKKYARR